MKSDKIKCHVCGHFAKESKFGFRGYDVRGFSCQNCGEKTIHSEDAGRIFAINKLQNEKKLHAKIAKVGNSFVFRIPKEIITALNLKDKGILEVRVASPKLITFSIA
ncbi:AbrB/MazE/SpoVT family DNA-binding domain-containing protein [Candidatus Micrarchaeota archaeon]|nr:AbrB/MazE/SpoVT family DNA-binding domain-containing protein [Candidatus Micrarchaeota archaeon]